ncbi:CbtA family protein [Pseudomonas lutea]|uniref:CbtA family protein n=1 Tax=Pseudomonas lutea TaxID=243924 RepID=A0ABR9AAQ3_9PSED|nr:CbtA family protein [Pseudomonas lutea]MBD8122912.1 CbtA family protein [Pseudomonas lutea]
MFKRILITACYTGAIAALLLTLVQSLWISPLILKAELLENAEATHEHVQTQQAHSHAAAEHIHDSKAWSPEDGWQRTLFTFGGNLVVAIGFALILCALYNLRAPTKVWHGVLWGAAGYVTFCLAPAAGLPPEMPGSVAADLSSRQEWWGATAFVTAAGLALLAFGNHWLWRSVALLAILAPHVVGAPQPLEHHSVVPAELLAQFQLASLSLNAVFWMVLGGLSCRMFRKENAGAAPLDGINSLA